MSSIADIIDERKKKSEKKSIRKLNTYRISYTDFCNLLELEANEVLIDRGDEKKFVVDLENKKFIENLYLYLTGNEDCEWKLNRGILVIGNYGSGKTILMLAFVGVNNFLAHNYRGKLIETIKYKEIETDKDLIKETKKPLFIDDFGKETKTVNDYGTKKNPVYELISARYEDGGVTFGTSNFDEKDLEDMYGEYLFERIKSMFNIIRLITKKSRRKIKNSNI